jgi:chloramphenicol-sensitive protein RarD
MGPDPKPTPPAFTGVALATGAFLCWGLFPIYFKLVGAVPAVEMLANRVVWSLLFVTGLITVLRGWPAVLAVFPNRRLVAILTLSAVVISLNWGVFIWAIANNRVLQSSLGYYINPLVSVVLGVVVLRERLRAAQWAAVGLAAAGVAYQVIGLGAFPWVALTLAFSFGFYGLIRKMAAVDAYSGLFVETLILSPVALAYLTWLEATGRGALGAGDWGLNGLIAASGVVTALPLILFVAGAKRIRLSTLGLLQYTVPTGHLLLAVFAYGEPFTRGNLVTFGCIWAALALYTFDTARREWRR